MACCHPNPEYKSDLMMSWCHVYLFAELPKRISLDCILADDIPIIRYLLIWLKNKTGWARLTKNYYAWIPRYRKSHTKLKSVKGIFCCVWVKNFVRNFKGAFWYLTKNFESIHRKIRILQMVKIWRITISVSYEIVSLCKMRRHSYSYPHTVNHNDWH